MQNNDKFGWKNYAISIVIMYEWCRMLGFVFITLDSLYIVIMLYFVTLYLSYRVKQRLPRIIVFFGVILATLIMFVVLEKSRPYIPFYEISSGYPIFIQFIYLFYPAVLGALTVILIFFYPLNKLFQEKSRFCVWGLTALLFFMIYICTGRDTFWSSDTPSFIRLDYAIMIFSPILIWFLVAQISKILNFPKKQIQEIESAA